MTEEAELECIYKACEWIENGKEEFSCNALRNSDFGSIVPYQKFLKKRLLRELWADGLFDRYGHLWENNREWMKTTRILALLLFHEVRWS